MNEGALKKAYAAAAVTSGGITSAVVLYTALVELLRSRGYAAPLPPSAAYVLKYTLYFLAVSPLPVIRLASLKLGGKKDSKEATVRALTALAVVKAAAAEVPALCGLLMFLLGGFRADFYLLAVFSLALEIYHFPRLGAWEERLRGDFGQL